MEQIHLDQSWCATVKLLHYAESSSRLQASLKFSRIALQLQFFDAQNN